MKLVHISVSEWDNNCYLLHSEGEGLLIDAADDAAALLDMARTAGVTITAVVTTHRHPDHVRALPEILRTTGAQHYASALDAAALPAPVDHVLEHGDTLSFAGEHLPVIILRGHTDGGACIVANIDSVPQIFVGDSLFPGGLGKTETPEAFEQLFSDVTTRLFDVYPDNTIIWPGHGKPTTLGAERPQLAQWHARKW